MRLHALILRSHRLFAAAALQARIDELGPCAAEMEPRLDQPDS